MVDIDGDFGDIMSVEVKRQYHFGTSMTFLAAIFTSRTKEWAFVGTRTEPTPYILRLRSHKTLPALRMTVGFGVTG